MYRAKKLWVCVAVLAAVSVSGGQELDLKKMFQEGIPVSPFAKVIYNYADAMLEHGRDTYGPQKTGLFLSALDRHTLSPLKTRPPASAGIRESDRPGPAGGPLVGANLQLDENLLRLMYFLKGLSGEDRYPLYPVEPVVRRAQVEVDGVLADIVPVLLRVLDFTPNILLQNIM